MNVSTNNGDDALTQMRKIERELRKLAPHNNGGATDPLLPNQKTTIQDGKQKQ